MHWPFFYAYFIHFLCKKLSTVFFENALKSTLFNFCINAYDTVNLKKAYYIKVLSLLV